MISVTLHTHKKIHKYKEWRRCIFSGDGDYIHVSSYCHICVLILLYMCPHTGRRVLLRRQRQRILLLQRQRILLLRRQRQPRRWERQRQHHQWEWQRKYRRTIYMCPHTAIYVSSYCYICVLILVGAATVSDIYVLILRYMCPHTAIYMCPHTAIYVS
jgi:hypothetical protein